MSIHKEEPAGENLAAGRKHDYMNMLIEDSEAYPR